MEQKNKANTGFNIDKILLVECSFSRAVNVSFDKDVENKVDVDVEVGEVNSATISVKETVIIEQTKGNTVQFSLKVTMIGVFQKVGETQIDMEKFGHINAAAIIFPFIREQIASLALKAGLGVILLPPVNFEERWKSNSK